MGQTSNPSLRYPDGTDRPRAVQIRHLAEDTKAAINGLEAIRDAASVAFTPTLVDAGGTALNLGTGGSITGRQATIGKQHIIDVEIIRGTDAWVGSGAWIVGNLPINARSWWFVFGFGYITGKNLPITVMRVAGSGVGLLGPGGRLSSAYPGSWGTEQIGFRVFYERS